MTVKLNFLSFVLCGALLLFGCTEKNTHEKANAFFREGRYDDAVRVYSEILKKNPNDLVSLKALADIKLIRKDFSGAMEGFKRVIEADPSKGVTELVSMLSFEKNVRDRVADTIKGLSNGKTEVINEMMSRMEAGNNYLRIDYLNVLERIGPGASFTAERTAKYLDDEHFGIRKAALDALGAFDANKLKEVGVIAKIVKRLQDVNIVVEEAAVRSLGSLKSGANETVPDLIEMLTKSNEIRDAAKQAIANIGPAAKSTVPALVALIDAKKPEIVRIAAIDSLAAMGSNANNAVADLIPLLQDNNNIIKTAAASALTKIGRPSSESVPGLIKLLQHKDVNVRLRAATELSEMGKAANAALAPLNAIIKDTSKYTTNELREEAKKAYGKISAAKR